MAQPFFMVLVCLILAYLLSEVCRRIGLPKIVGQIIAGLILSIGIIKQFIFSPENLKVLSFLANLGTILLFYYVGLGTNFQAFTKNIKKSVLVSLFNSALPFIVGFLIMKYNFHLNTLASMIVGVSLSVSAQSVSIDLLEELKLLKSKIGNLIISAGAVDDIIELVLVTVILSVFHFTISHLTLQRFFIDILLFLLFVIAARQWFVPFMLKIFDKEKSSTARFMGSLIIVLLIASLSEFLGIGLLIGAMVAGMIMRQTIFKDVHIPDWEERDIARSIHILAFGFLIPLFFVWIGVNAGLSQISTQVGFILLLLAIATIGTVGGTIVAVLLSKGSFKEGALLGWGLNPKGDIELIIIALALKAGIISLAIFSSLVMMSLLTTIISPIVFKMMLTRWKVVSKEK